MSNDFIPSRRTAVTIRFDKETFTSRDVELTLIYFVPDLDRKFVETLASYVAGDITINPPQQKPQTFEVAELVFGYAQRTITRLANVAGYNVVFLPADRYSAVNVDKAIFTKVVG